MNTTKHNVKNNTYNIYLVELIYDIKIQQNEVALWGNNNYILIGFKKPLIPLCDNSEHFGDVINQSKPLKIICVCNMPRVMHSEQAHYTFRLQLPNYSSSW